MNRSVTKSEVRIEIRVGFQRGARYLHRGKGEMENEQLNCKCKGESR